MKGFKKIDEELFEELEKVLVMSTGMGGPSTAIGVQELANLGVDTLIRVGTCGGMQEDIMGGGEVKHTRSREYASHIMEAMVTGKPYQIGGNVINHGLISNLLML